MLIHGKIPHTKVNGPGDRAMIHVQGCNIGCRSCWNPETHPMDMSKEVNTSKIINWLCDNAIDGITFSGGEPMQQAFSISAIVQIVRKRRPELSFGMYTGYNLSELEGGRYQLQFRESATQHYWAYVLVANPWLDIKPYLDFAIMGRFNIDQLDNTTSLRSSRNQKLHLFTDRYKESDFKQQEIEFTVGENGLVQITGFPVGLPGLLDEMREW